LDGLQLHTSAIPFIDPRNLAMPFPTQDELAIGLRQRSVGRRISPARSHEFGANFPLSVEALDVLAPDTQRGLTIDRICPFGYWQLPGEPGSSSDNHCAHFVSHVLGVAGMGDKECASRAAGKAHQHYYVNGRNEWKSKGGKASGQPAPRYEKLYTREGAADRAIGVSIEVMHLFSLCESAGSIEDWQDNLDDSVSGLMFIGTPQTLVKRSGKWTLSNGEKKHVGIFIGQQVWHFSNGRFKRVVRQTATDMRSHYGKGTVLTRSTALPARTWSAPPSG
jgi:hypothetical protein